MCPQFVVPCVPRFPSPLRTTSGDTLELVEESLDTELLNNAVRLHIQGCPLLPGGVHLCEVQNHLVLLLVTVQSVHRVLLPHPAYAYRGVSGIEGFLRGLKPILVVSGSFGGVAACEEEEENAAGKGDFKTCVSSWGAAIMG